jgi:ribosome recycling factor
MENESIISEDDLHRGEEKMQEKTNSFIEQVDQIVREKDAEIMTV